MNRTSEQLDSLRKVYEPHSEWAVSELAAIDQFERELEQTNDPSLKAFRENPITIKLANHAATIYKKAVRDLSEDDGTMTQLERARLDVAKKWALWYLKALGNDPDETRRKIEREIESMAAAAGIINNGTFGAS